MGTGMLLIVIGVYFLPWLSALASKHPYSGAIAVANLFLGWTLIGWIVCLIWAQCVKKEENETNMYRKNIVVLTENDTYIAKDKKLKLCDYKRLKNKSAHDLIIQTSDFYEIQETIKNNKLLSSVNSAVSLMDTCIKDISLFALLRIWAKLTIEQKKRFKKKYSIGYETLRLEIIKALFQCK